MIRYAKMCKLSEAAMNKTLLKFSSALVMFCAAIAPAFSASVSADGSGWIESNGSPNSIGFSDGIHNNLAGLYLQTFDDWFSFALPTSSFPVVSATLNIWNDSRNTTIDPNALYSLYQASSFSFSGLTTGPALGSITFGAADTGVSQYVSISLNSTGIALLNANLGGSFVFGGGVTSIVDPSNCLSCVAVFGYTDGNPLARLDISTAPVPEPETYAMMLIGLGLIGFVARPYKNQQA